MAHRTIPRVSAIGHRLVQAKEQKPVPAGPGTSRGDGAQRVVSFPQVFKSLFEYLHPNHLAFMLPHPLRPRRRKPPIAGTHAWFALRIQLVTEPARSPQ